MGGPYVPTKRSRDGDVVVDKRPPVRIGAASTCSSAARRCSACWRYSMPRRLCSAAPAGRRRPCPSVAEAAEFRFRAERARALRQRLQMDAEVDVDAHARTIARTFLASARQPTAAELASRQGFLAEQPDAVSRSTRRRRAGLGRFLPDAAVQQRVFIRRINPTRETVACDHDHTISANVGHFSAARPGRWAHGPGTFAQTEQQQRPRPRRPALADLPHPPSRRRPTP